MAKQTFTTGQVLTAAQMTSLQQTAMGGGSATAKTASYTLVAADAGATVIMNSASATTITVNTSLFSAGDTVFLQNIGAGVCTVTAGTATVNTAASLALAQYASGTLYFTAASAAIFSKADGAGAGASITNDTATVATNEVTTSTSYTDLATSGPAVTVTTGTTVLVIVTGAVASSTNNTGYMSYGVTGATTSAATDARSLYFKKDGSNYPRASAASILTVTAGSNTFTAKYKTDAGTTYFSDRNIIVINLN